MRLSAIERREREARAEARLQASLRAQLRNSIDYPNFDNRDDLWDPVVEECRSMTRDLMFE